MNTVQRFVLQEGFRNLAMGFTVFSDDFLRHGELLVDDLGDGHVDAAGGFIAMPLGARNLATQEDGVRVLVVGNGAEVAHPPIANHLAGHPGGLLDVLRGTARDIARDNTLADATRHRGTDEASQPGLRTTEGILGGHEHGHTEGTTTRNNGDLVDRQSAVIEHGLHEGVAGFMVSRLTEVFLVGTLAALAAMRDLIAGFFDVAHLHLVAITTASMERGFVKQVGEVGTRHPRGDAGDAL